MTDPEVAPQNTKKLDYKVKAGLFLGSVTGLSILCGFGFTLAMAKKKDPHLFLKGMGGSREAPESGGQLAMRALGWGTFYAVTGFSTFCFLVWKAFGVNDLQEFRQKVGSMLPVIPKSEKPGRSEFKSVRELVDYILDEDKKSKR